jgi:hypothetical protein
MKKVGEIMKDMGFNSESSENTQKAFIKYLLRVANKTAPQEVINESHCVKKPRELQLFLPNFVDKTDSEAS